LETFDFNFQTLVKKQKLIRDIFIARGEQSDEGKNAKRSYHDFDVVLSPCLLTLKHRLGSLGAGEF